MNEIMIRIFSIFRSISGEISKWPQGTPVTFIRFAGCNLCCSYCDTKESIAKDSGRFRTIDEIINTCEKYNCKKIIITGGEPLVQLEEFVQLVKRLLFLDYEIAIETNGSLDYLEINNKYPEIFWVTDIKMPGSKMYQQMQNIEKYKNYNPKNNHYKFVCSDLSDLDIVEFWVKSLSYHQISLSAAGIPHKDLWEEMQRRSLLRNKILNVQIHKIIGLE